MPNSVQVNGRTVEEAINKGLAELGLTREQVDVELISSPAGATGEALVRLTAREDTDAYVMSAPAPSFAPRAAAPSPRPRTTVMRRAARQKAIPRPLWRGRCSRSSSPAWAFARKSSSAPTMTPPRVPILCSTLWAPTSASLSDVAARPCVIWNIYRASSWRKRLVTTSALLWTLRAIAPVANASCVELARRMADRVKQSHQPITLEAMPPHERRIVHITLRDHPSVKTQSIGEGEHRRVMILPK